MSCPYGEYTNTSDGADYDCALGFGSGCESCPFGTGDKSGDVANFLVELFDADEGGVDQGVIAYLVGVIKHAREKGYRHVPEEVPDNLRDFLKTADKRYGPMLQSLARENSSWRAHYNSAMGELEEAHVAMDDIEINVADGIRRLASTVTALEMALDGLLREDDPDGMDARFEHAQELMAKRRKWREEFDADRFKE